MLVRCQPSLLTAAVPLQTVDDDYYFFRAVSRAVYGYEEEHLALRLMCALEVGLNASLYDGTSPQRHQLLRQGLVVCPEYFKVRTSNRRL